MAIQSSTRTPRKPGVRHGGRRKRFDVKFEKFWFSSEKLTALTNWGRSQPGSMDYSDVMRLVVDHFITSKRIPVPPSSATLATLTGQTDR